MLITAGAIDQQSLCQSRSPRILRITGLVAFIIQREAKEAEKEAEEVVAEK